MSNIAQLAAPKPLYEAYNDLAKQIVGLDKPRKRTNLGFEQDTRSRVIRNSRLSLRYIEHVFIRQKHTQDNLAIAMGALGNALYYAYDDKGNTTLEKLLDDAKSRLEKYDADTADANLEILKTGDYRAVLDLKTRLERELESSDSDDDDEDVEFEETLDAVVDVLEFRFYKTYAQDECNKVIDHLSEDENALITAILEGITMKKAETCATGLATLCDNTGAGASAAAPSPRDTNKTDFLATTDYIRETNLEKRNVGTLMDNLDQIINIAGDRRAQIAEVKAEFSTTKTEMDNTNSLLSYLLISSLEEDDTVVNALEKAIKLLNHKIQQLSTPKNRTWLQSVLTKNAPKMIAEFDNQIAALRGHLAHITTRK